MDSFRDIGASKDYVRAMWDIVNNNKPDDFCVATGDTYSIRQICDLTFSKLGLNYKDYVIQNDKYLRSEELPYLRGDSTKIRTQLGWKPKYTFHTLLDEMIEYWLKFYRDK